MFEYHVKHNTTNLIITSSASFSFVKIYAYSEFDSSNMFQTSWNRGNKRLEKLKKKKKKHLIGTFLRLTGELVTCARINRLGYKRDILKRLSSSRARVGRSSPVCGRHGCSIKDITTWGQEQKTLINMILILNTGCPDFLGNQGRIFSYT